LLKDKHGTFDTKGKPQLAHLRRKPSLGEAAISSLPSRAPWVAVKVLAALSCASDNLLWRLYGPIASGWAVSDSWDVAEPAAEGTFCAVYWSENREEATSKLLVIRKQLLALNLCSLDASDDGIEGVSDTAAAFHLEQKDSNSIYISRSFCSVLDLFSPEDARIDVWQKTLDLAVAEILLQTTFDVIASTGPPSSSAKIRPRIPSKASPEELIGSVGPSGGPDKLTRVPNKDPTWRSDNVGNQ
jgi:hypothetical protein